MNAAASPLVSVLVAAGGRGVRLGVGPPKQFLEVAGRTILEWSLAPFAGHPAVTEIVVALPADGLEPAAARLRARGWGHVRCVAGGARRQDSVAAAFAAARADTDLVLVHDAARPFVTPGLIDRTIAAAAVHGAAVAALPVRDTVKQAAGLLADGIRPVAATLSRDDIYLAQTPQAFRRAVLARALETAARLGLDATDEAGLVERAGDPVVLVDGDPDNVKITTARDFDLARRRLEPAPDLPRIGTGYDLHRLVDGRRLILAGVTIPFGRGLDGHSDADIVCHAVTDAVLGAAALGDIGRLFPDTDPQWAGADSLALLERAVARLHESGWRVGNVDVTIIAEQPKLLPYVEAMQANLGRVLAVESCRVSVKGKTNERMDSTGRGESMACHAVALVCRR